MSDKIVKKVVAKVEKMSTSGKEFKDKELQEFAITVEHLLNERIRKEEILALAAANMALTEYKKGLEKRIEYAKLGGLKEREATFLEILDQIDKELEMAVTMKIHEHAFKKNFADEINEAILEHLEPTLVRGKWLAREKEAIL